MGRTSRVQSFVGWIKLAPVVGSGRVGGSWALMRAYTRQGSAPAESRALVVTASSKIGATIKKVGGL
jgi:hypothetical protein